MSRYRRIAPSLWREPAFCGLDQIGRLVALYVLSGPQSTAIGLGAFSIGQASEDLEIAPLEVRAALDAVCLALGWQYDATARVLWICRFWRDNPPENPNVLTSLLRGLAEVPRCELRARFAAHEADLRPGLRATFKQGVDAALGRHGRLVDAVLGETPEPPDERSHNVPPNVPTNVQPDVPANVSSKVGATFGERLPKQDQDQDQEQEGTARTSDNPRRTRASLPSLVAKGWLAQVVGKALVTGADVDAFGRHVAAHVARNGYTLAPGTHAFRWLDERLAEFLQQRSARAASDAAADSTARFIAHHEAIAKSIPRRTPEEVRALLGRPPGRGADEASAR